MSKTLEEMLAPLKPWLDPIPGDAKAGTAAKFDPGYEQLRVEVAKLDSPRGELVDWAVVLKIGTDILTNKSKDLVIAAHAAVAMYHEKGLDGLVSGTAFLGELMDQYWEDMFPPVNRIRGRVGALEWFLEKTTLLLTVRKSVPAERASFELLDQRVQRMREVVSARFAENAPATTPIKEIIGRILIELPKEKPPEPKAPPAPAPAPAATKADAAAAPQRETVITQAPEPSADAPAPAVLAAAPAATLAAGADIGPFLSGISQSLIEAATTLRRAQPTDANAYRLLRTGVWLPIVNAPAIIADGKTKLPSLPKPLRDKLETVRGNANFAGMLEQAEGALPMAPFFLDLQRYAAEAMKGLGETYNPARRALIAEVRAFVGRLPTLQRLLCNDGLPFADEATRTWIAEEIEVKAQNGGGGGDKPVVGDDVMQNANKLLGEGKANEAVALFQALVQSAPDARSRFRVRLAQAEFCRKSNALKVATAIYSALEAELATRQLENWEPKLVAECLSGYLRCLRGGPKPNEQQAKTPEATKQREEEQRIYDRLAQVEPALALQLAM